MMKKQRTKEMSGEEPETKTKELEIQPEKKLICRRECHMPGIGDFKHGQIVTDQRVIAIISDNPSFEEIREEE